MIKKTYHISGFDCPNCAHKSEAHLAKHPLIEEVVIDFNNDRLFVTYKEEELSTEQIKSIIKEVEDDEITIEHLNEHKEEHHHFFDKEIVFILIRIIIAAIVMTLSLTILNKAELFWYAFGVNLFGLLVISYDVYFEVIEHIVHKEDIVDEHLLMTLTSIGAFVLASISRDIDIYFEALMVMTLFQIGEIIEHYASHKSKEAISSAVKLRIETANKVVGESVIKVKPQELDINDIFIVSTGERIPVDGAVVDGNASIDTSSLTGEFVPVSVSNNKEVLSGCMVVDGSIKVKVLSKYEDSAVSKIINLIENSGEKKSKADQFVSKFARIYTPIILLVGILTAVIGGAITQDWNGWILLGLKMLLVGCPCAVVISVPLAYFASIGLASKNGIVIKGTNYLDSLVNLKKVVTDKTGTLTKGVFEISKVESIGCSKDELLEYLLAAETLSNHPIAKAIVNSANSEINVKSLKNFLQIPGFGVSVNYKQSLILAGNKALLDRNKIVFNEASEYGTTIYVAKDNKYLGYVVLNDAIKDESYQMVKLFNSHNIETILLTGDKEENAKFLADQLGIKKYKGNLLPEDKTIQLEKQLDKHYTTAFIGDGINDAACIKEADVGFAMGAIGSDVAIDNADVILMRDDPSKVYDSYKIAKIARHTALFNIIFALSIKIGVEVAAIVANLVGQPHIIPMWLAALTDTGLTVVLIINSLLILSRKIKRKSV